MKPEKAASLQQRLDYQFTDQSLLTLALTHRSRGAHNYERLEFLGDSILGFVVAEWLYQAFPDLTEGRLSRMRSSLVRKETLAEVARDLLLPDFLILGEGELKSGGYNRDSILADTIESIIGAMYLDAGLRQTRRFIHARFDTQMQRVAQKTSHKDPKSRLQEAMQKYGYRLPDYQVESVAGEQHEQRFTVRCSIVDLQLSATALDRSRRGAEQFAAQKVLALLHQVDPKKFKSAEWQAQ